MTETSFQPTFGQPCVFDPLETGLTIERLWPNLHIGAERLPEMQRKIATLPWARQALSRWQAEAETILSETPQFSLEDSGGRTAMFTNDGHYLSFDPRCQAPMWDPLAMRFVAPRDAAGKAWVTLTHERLRRLMGSLAFLWRLTGDSRYAEWVWAGLMQSLALYRSAPGHHSSISPGRSKWGVVYSGLYEAQSMLELLPTFELIAEAEVGSAEARQAVIDDVFIPVGERLSAWMDLMIVHNMSCWSMSALVELGRVARRPEWIEKAFNSERCGLTLLLERGLPRHQRSGRPDGFWFEHSPFYGCFYVITSLIPLYRAAEAAGILSADLRKRFATFFEAPPHLADPELRLLSISDRVAPGTMRLTQMRHLYEYAAGQLDARHGPLLSLLYQRCGAARTSLAAVAFGPDELPAPAPPAALTHSCALPEAGLVTFRAQTDHGAATLWFSNLRRYAGSAQGHHHMDKLSLSLHAFGTVVTSDLGWPGLEPDPTRGSFLNGTLSHNTVMLDEYDQGSVGAQTFACDLDAPVPWARGSFTGHTADKLFETFRDHHHGRLQEGLYDDAVMTRTVWFDFPYIVLLDELVAQSAKRFGFVFHARGPMVVRTTPGREALALPPLPEDEAWQHFTGGAGADPVARFTADWRIRADIYLRLVARADGDAAAAWGTTPDNPADIRRGTIVLRAPGSQRRFATVLELHAGTPTVVDIDTTDNGVVVDCYDDRKRVYPRPA